MTRYIRKKELKIEMWREEKKGRNSGGEEGYLYENRAAKFEEKPSPLSAV